MLKAKSENSCSCVSTKKQVHISLRNYQPQGGPSFLWRPQPWFHVPPSVSIIMEENGNDKLMKYNTFIINATICTIQCKACHIGLQALLICMHSQTVNIKITQITFERFPMGTSRLDGTMRSIAANLSVLNRIGFSTTKHSLRTRGGTQT